MYVTYYAQFFKTFTIYPYSKLCNIICTTFSKFSIICTYIKLCNISITFSKLLHVLMYKKANIYYFCFLISLPKIFFCIFSKIATLKFKYFILSDSRTYIILFLNFVFPVKNTTQYNITNTHFIYNCNIYFRCDLFVLSCYFEVHILCFFQTHE